MKIRNLIFSGLLVFSHFASAKGKAKTVSHVKVMYPRIESLQGKASLVDDLVTIVGREARHSEKTKQVKKNMILKDKALIRLAPDSMARIRLSESSTLILEANSEVLLPEISWTDGSVKEIHLFEGPIRYICNLNCDRKVIAPLYAGVPPVGDYLISYDPKTPKIEMSVLRGETPFRGLENEQGVVLHAGERAVFTGALGEDGEPAFDVLLKDRKVAKGKLGPVEKIPAEELNRLLKQEEEQIAKAKAKPKAKRKESQICDRPWGELNQCAWICEKNPKKAKTCQTESGAVCVRERCNANGEWSDRQELPASQNPCKAESFVGVCDY